MWIGNEESLQINSVKSTDTIGLTARLQRLGAAGNGTFAGPKYTCQVGPFHISDGNDAQTGPMDTFTLTVETILILERSESNTTSNFLNWIYQIDLDEPINISAVSWNTGLMENTFQSVDQTLLFSTAVGGSQDSSMERLAWVYNCRPSIRRPSAPSTLAKIVVI